MRKPKNVFGAFEKYQEVSIRKEAEQVKTALIRYLVPGLGGPIPKGRRSAPEEIDAGLEFLKSVSLRFLWQPEKALERGFKLQNATSASIRNYRSVLRRLSKWSEEQGWKTKRRKPRTTLDKNTLKIDNRNSYEAAQDELVKKYGKQEVGEKIRLTNEEIVLIPKLQAELKKLEIYLLRSRYKDSTLKAVKDLTLKLLGWMYRYDNVPLEELCLTSLIPYVKLKYDLLDITNSNPELSPGEILFQEAIKKLRAQRECEAKYREVEAWFERYRESYAQSSRYTTLEKTVDTLIILSKYIYRYETSFLIGNRSYSDVPIITKLRELSIELKIFAKAQPRQIPYCAKSVSWEKVEKLLIGLKRDADTSINPINGYKRTRQAIAADNQRLLIAMLFVVTPPRRANVIRTLEVREAQEWEQVNTLERGRTDLGESFIPEYKLPSGIGSQWVMRLRNFKTIKTYGPQDITLHNFIFDDGTSFYSYLDLWLKKNRLAFDPIGDDLFVGTATEKTRGRLMGAAVFSELIRRATFKHLGVAITPQTFRKMFVTYVKRLPGISESEREDIAWSMGHSKEMQDEIYDETTNRQRGETLARVNFLPQGLSREPFSE